MSFSIALCSQSSTLIQDGLTTSSGIGIFSAPFENVLYYINTNVNRALYKLDGDISSPQNALQGTTSGNILASIGLNSNATNFYSVPYVNSSGSSIDFQTFSTTDASLVSSQSYTVSTFNQTRIKGSIVTDSSGYHYFVDVSSRRLYQIIDTSTIVICYSGILLAGVNDLTLWNDGSGNEYLIFSSYNGTDYWINYIKIADIPTSPTQFNVPAGLSTLGSPYLSVTVDQPNNTLFVAFQRTITQLGLNPGTPPTLSFTPGNTFTLASSGSGDSSAINNLKSNSASGYQPGNTRLFASTVNGSNAYFYKIYNNDPSQILGVSIGGDPKISTISGKEILVTEEDDIEFLDTIDESTGEKNGVYTYFNSFNIGKHPELVSAYQYVAVDNKESFMRTFNIIYFDSSRRFEIVVNMVSLELEKNENCENVKITPLIDCQVLSKENYPIIRSKKYRNDLLFFRKIIIFGKDHVIDLEFIRTKCINYSDINVRLSGKRKFSGICMDEEVKPPRYLIGKE